MSCRQILSVCIHKNCMCYLYLAAGTGTEPAWILVPYIRLSQGCPNASHLVLWLAEFCVVAPFTFSIITAVVSLHTESVSLHMHQAGSTEKAEFHRSLQSCDSSVWNLLNTTLLTPRTCRWLPEFWKISRPSTVHRSRTCIGAQFQWKTFHKYSYIHINVQTGSDVQ